MIHIKSQKEVEIMRKGGKILADVLWEVLEAAKPGVSELELDTLAEKLIREKGGEPGFMKVPGYNYTICVSTNDTVVHGIPTDYRLQKGDILGIDCGVYLDGFHTDMSHSIIVGGNEGADEKAVNFLDTGEKALMLAIQQAKIGNHIWDISKTIQTLVEGAGYSVVRELIGHGVGKDLHEDPEIPGYVSHKREKTPILKEGMVIAIEIIYNMGKKEIRYAGGEDEWTIKTADGSLSGLFERTVAITKNGPEILTQ
ncbi:MAG TPA: type I methionyl aminopeptidase [Patescibacteria group bacterium]|nr:type I methionyl aminopeptidase [Patescibacteria group bacterium]